MSARKTHDHAVTVAAAEKRLAEADAAVSGARDDVARLAADEARLDLDDAKIAAHAAKADIAARKLKVAERLQGEAADTLAAARAGATEAQRLALRDEAAKAVKDAAALVARDYPIAVATVERIQAVIANANELAHRANASVAEGEERIQDVEGSLNRVPRRPHEIVSQGTERLWAYQHSEQPLPPELQAQVVIARDGSGIVRREPAFDGANSYNRDIVGLMQKTFAVTKFKAAEIGLFIESLSGISLPPLRIEAGADVRPVQVSHRVVREEAAERAA